MHCFIKVVMRGDTYYTKYPINTVTTLKGRFLTSFWDVNPNIKMLKL